MGTCWCFGYAEHDEVSPAGSAVVLNHDGTPSPIGDVRIVGEEDEDLMSRDVVTTIQRRKVIRPTHIMATDYNYETPNNWLGRGAGPERGMLTVSGIGGADAAGARQRSSVLGAAGADRGVGGGQWLPSLSAGQSLQPDPE